VRQARQADKKDGGANAADWGLAREACAHYPKVRFREESILVFAGKIPASSLLAAIHHGTIWRFIS
jgi:hypothetical protein